MTVKRPDKKEKKGMGQQITMTMGEGFPGEISKQHERELGIVEWRISDTTVAKIEAIESNIRLSESQSGLILVS